MATNPQPIPNKDQPSPNAERHSPVRRGGRRVPGPGKKLGPGPSTVAGILASLPDKHKKAFLRSVEAAVEEKIEGIIRGADLKGANEASSAAEVEPFDGNDPAAQAPTRTQSLSGSGKPEQPHSRPSSGRGGRRVPGRGKKLGRPPFTVEGICRRYPRRAERLNVDILRLAMEEMVRRLGVTIAGTRRTRTKRPGAMRNNKELASEARPGWGGGRLPGPGKRIGRPLGTHNPRNLPLFLRTLRAELGIHELSDMRVAVPLKELSELMDGKAPRVRNRGGRRRQAEETKRYFEIGLAVEEKIPSHLKNDRYSIVHARRQIAYATHLEFDVVAQYHKKFRRRKPV